MDILEKAKQKLAKQKSEKKLVKISRVSAEKKITPGEKQIEQIAQKKKSEKLHILTEENLIHFIQEEKRTKLYEMRIRFYKNSINEIDMLIKKLFKESKLTKNKNGWISLKR